MRVVQLLPSMAYGDAIGNDALAMDAILKGEGVESGIYAGTIHPRLAGRVQPLEGLPHLGKQDVLLYHMSTAWDRMELLEAQDCVKVMVYHNITPPEYYEGYSPLAGQAAAEGRRQLAAMNGWFDLCLADSQYNGQELEDLGYRCPIAVLPCIVPFEDYAQEPSAEVLARYEGDDWENILFLGRIVPNKCQQDVIAAFHAYKKLYQPKARLFLVGAHAGMGHYYAQLENYVRVLGTEDVFFTGHVDFREILAYYRLADLFLCMSRHEGFCVPLLEAMQFDIPVVALGEAAVPGTLAGTGRLLENADPAGAATAMHEVLLQPGERERLVAGQKAHLHRDFGYEGLKARFLEILAPFIQ